MTIPSKALVRRLHTYVALFVGLFLVLQGLSGTVLLYREAVEPVLHPDLSVERANHVSTHDENLAMVMQRYPDHVVKRVELPKEATRAVIYKLEGREDAEPFLAAVDPYRNEVVRDGPISAWPIEWLLHWHEQLHAGDLGETIVGSIGFALLFLVVSGLVVWWPKSRLRDGFRISGGTGRTTWVLRHRAVGATASILLILSGTTGALMVFKDGFRDALARFGPVAPKPSLKVKARVDERMQSLAELRPQADRIAAGAPLRQLRFSGDQSQGVSFYYDAPPGTFGGITNFVSFDRYSGKETGRYVSSQLPVNNNLVDYLYTLHTGNAAGGLLKVLLLFAGLALAFLPLSGFYTWMSKRALRTQSINKSETK